MAHARSSDSQPKHAVQLHLGPGLLQKIISASEKGSCPTLRVETAGGVLTVGNREYRLRSDAGPQNTVLRIPDGHDQTSLGSLAVVQQKLHIQESSAVAEAPDHKLAAAQQPQSQAPPKQQPPRPGASSEEEPVAQSRVPSSGGPVSGHASGAQRAKSGSPPPWAHLVGQNAVFRPALGTREPTPPAAPVSSPEQNAVPASQGTASAKAPVGQHREAPSSNGDHMRSSSPDVAAVAIQEPSKGKGAPASSRGCTPEPRLQPQQVPKHAADSGRKANPKQQKMPQHLRVRSQTGTPEPPSQALKQLVGQPGQPRSLVPAHVVAGKPPLRPSPGSSRDATPDDLRPSPRGGTPDSVNLSSSSGPAILKTSRDNTPQPGGGGHPLGRPSPLGRPGSAPTLPGAAAHAGRGAPAKAIKKTRKLLGKKGTAKKKAGQGMDEGRGMDMDIPTAALLGARKGLIYCLVGLISHRRYSSKSLTKAVAEVAWRVKDMRNPSSELLREQALKIAEYKSPGMWVLLERYQKHADELRAEAEKAALPDEAVAAASADATLEPEAPPANKAPQRNYVVGKASAAAHNIASTYTAKQPLTPAKQQPQLQRQPKGTSLSKPAQGEAPKQVGAAAPEEQRRAPSNKRKAPVHDKHVEISDTESEGRQPASKRPAYSGRPSVTTDAGALRPAPSLSPRPAHLCEQPAIRGRPTAMAEAPHLRLTPSPSPRAAPQREPAKPGPGGSTTPHSTLMRESPSPPQLSRPQTPSELQTSHEADDTWYAEHAQREPMRHAPVNSSSQYNRYVEEYDVKHEDYMQIHQAIRRTRRYVSAIEAGFQAAKTKHEEDWYNQQAERLGKRVQPLMQHWCSAYRVLHEELQDIKGRLEEYHQLCASSEDAMADD